MSMMGGCNQAEFQDLDQSGRVCYGLMPRLPNNTHASYSVTDDPEDPLFYATCFVKKSQWTFDRSLGNITVITPVPPSWGFANKCVDCMEWKASQENMNIPYWALPENCVNCETATLPPVPALPGSLLSSGTQCDGGFNGQTTWTYRAVPASCANKRCVKSLFIVGANDIMADECIAKAKMDPDCTEFVQHKGNGANFDGCECLIKDPCCGICSAADSFFSNWEWNIYTTAPQPGDPQCARGVLSADNAYCCSATCKDANGVAVCMPVPGLQVSFRGLASTPPDGWAVDNGALFGPRTNPGYNSSLSPSSYGWNCDLRQSTEDRSTLVGVNFRSTVVIPDNTKCTGSAIPTWSVSVPNGNYQVDTLYSKPFAPISGCMIQGIANYDKTHSQLGFDDMAWVSRTVNTTSGTIVLSGGTNNQCGDYAAVVIWDKTKVPSSTYCQTLPGMCCPLFIDMANRPCASFEAPCKM